MRTRRQVVHELNKRQISGASKYVFSSVANPILTKLVNKELSLSFIQ